MEKKDFAEVLTDIRNGVAHGELTSAVHKLVAAVQKTGRPGQITLSLVIKPQGEGQVEIQDKITTKLPEHAKPSTYMFVDDEGNLTRECPRQGNLFDLKVVVDKSTGELKEVENGSN